MKFNKQNARRYGRRGGLAAQAKKARENFDGNARGARLSQELKAFEDFENAESGIFDGFEMAEIFHKNTTYTTRLNGATPTTAPTSLQARGRLFTQARTVSRFT